MAPVRNIRIAQMISQKEFLELLERVSKELAHGEVPDLRVRIIELEKKREQHELVVEDINRISGETCNALAKKLSDVENDATRFGNAIESIKYILEHPSKGNEAYQWDQARAIARSASKKGTAKPKKRHDKCAVRIGKTHAYLADGTMIEVKRSVSPGGMKVWLESGPQDEVKAQKE